MTRLNTIDLFAGAGGMSLGLEMAGFDVKAAIESVPRAAQTHQQNFRNCRMISGDIQEFSAKQFAEAAEIAPGQIDLLAGGPPCQTFSTIGRAKIRSIKSEIGEKADPRNYLFSDFFNYVSFFQPNVFLMENVPAIKSKYKGQLFSRILEIVDKLDYEVHISTLNSADFGVPQTRKRLFIVGTKKGLKFSFPSCTHQNPEKKSEDEVGLSELAPYRTVRDALGDLPEIFDGCREHRLPYRTGAASEYQKLLRSKNGLVGNNICRMSNDRAKTVFRHMEQGAKYMDLDPEVRKILPFREDIFHDRLKRLRSDKPSWTVLAHIGMDGYMYIHPTETRTLSVREAARIQSFSDEFEFVGNMREQYVQVGNAVPPLLAKALGKSIAKCLR
jgi:DNA (cytosine-5)-methyltransferase 1